MAAGGETFPSDQFKAAPVVLTSIHGAYYVDAKLEPFTIPANVHVFETQVLGDYCLTNIDEPLWDLLQGKYRNYFHRILSGKQRKGDDETYIQVIKNLTYYAPGDQIYPRGLSIGGGRGSGPGGGSESSRIAYANMGFYLFPNDGTSADVFPSGTTTKIFQPLRTEMIGDANIIATTDYIIEKALTEKPELREGCIFVFSACAGAFNMGLPPKDYDLKVHAIEALQQLQRQKFMALTGVAPGGAINKRVPKGAAAAAAGKAPGAGVGAEPTALFSYAMREAVRGAKPEGFHPSAFGESENAMSALADPRWAERAVPAHPAAPAQPAGTSVYFEATASGTKKQILDESGSPYMTPAAIRLWRRKNPGKQILELRGGTEFAPVTLGGRRRKQTRKVSRKRRQTRRRR